MAEAEWQSGRVAQGCEEAMERQWHRQGSLVETVKTVWMDGKLLPALHNLFYN